jgi:acyl dehydratase
MTPLPALPLPPLNAVTLLRLLVRRPRGRTDVRIPGTRFALDRIDAAHVARYRERFGFAGAGIPLTWWYLPAQRAQLATMLHDAFPFRLPGSVHTANALRAWTEPDPARPLVLDTAVTILPPAGNGAVRAVLDTVGTQDGMPIFDCVSTYLVVRGAARGKTDASSDAKDAAAAMPALASWRVAPDDGRRYAALSGDWNPIHLWPWSARLMGMRRPIIHGMHTLAHACVALERAHGAPLGRLDARFRSPVPLGSAPVLHADAAGEAYAVVLDGRVAVAGTAAVVADRRRPAGYD